MTIGSALSGFDRFSGFSAGRMGGINPSSNNMDAAYGNAENVNDPSRVGGAWNAENGKGADGAKNKNGRSDKGECQTCKNRKYQDGSNDPGVSFKSPTKMSPEQAASAVLGHEMEHVTRNQAKAKSEGREVISQSVMLHSAICPECGRSYIAGGVTRTVTGERTKKDDEQEKLLNKFGVGLSIPSKESGRQLDALI